MSAAASLYLPFGEPNGDRRLQILPPPLPSSVRYVDDYTEESHVIRNFDEPKWLVSCNGKMEGVSFERYVDDDNLIGVLMSTSRYLDGICHGNVHVA